MPPTLEIPLTPVTAGPGHGPHNRRRFEEALHAWLAAPSKPRLTLPGAAEYELDAADGLRAGVRFDSRFGGLRLDMNGAALTCLGTPTWLDGAALQVDGDAFGYVDPIGYQVSGDEFVVHDGDFSRYAPGDCVVLFLGSYQPESGGRSPFQQVTEILSVDPARRAVKVADNLIAGVDAAKWVRGGRRFAELSPGGGVLAGQSPKFPFRPGDYAFVSDGVGVNQPYGEFVCVTAVSADAPGAVTLTWDGALSRPYDTARAFAAPGPWAADVTVENGTVNGSLIGAESVCASFGYCPGLAVRNLRFTAGRAGLYPQRAGMSLAGHALFDRCRFETGVQVNSSHGVTFRDCRGRDFNFEEWTRDCLMSNCDAGRSVWCNLYTGTGRLRLENCRFGGLYDLMLGGGSSMADCRVLSYAPGAHQVMLSGDNIAVRNCDFGGGYVAAYPGSGYVFDGVRAGALTFAPGATGRAENVTCVTVPFGPPPPDGSAGGDSAGEGVEA